MVRDQHDSSSPPPRETIRSLYEQKARLQRAGYLRAIGRFHHYRPGFIENRQLTLPLLKLLPFVRTRHIRLRLSCGKGNQLFRVVNVEPSRCHNEGMKARAYRNKSREQVKHSVCFLMCPRFGFLFGRWAALDRGSPSGSLEQLVGRSTDATLPSIRTPLGGSCVRRIPLESRACSEPNLQPELDETPEPCVSPRHDAAKRTIGTSIREDVLRP